MRTKPTKQELAVLIASTLCLLFGWLTPALSSEWQVVQRHALEVHAGIAIVGLSRVAMAMIRDEDRFCWQLYVALSPDGAVTDSRSSDSPSTAGTLHQFITWRFSMTPIAAR
jgi:hypothetical protein